MKWLCHLWSINGTNPGIESSFIFSDKTVLITSKCRATFRGLSIKRNHERKGVGLEELWSRMASLHLISCDGVYYPSSAPPSDGEWLWLLAPPATDWDRANAMLSWRFHLTSCLCNAAFASLPPFFLAFSFHSIRLHLAFYSSEPHLPLWPAGRLFKAVSLFQCSLSAKHCNWGQSGFKPILCLRLLAQSRGLVCGASWCVYYSSALQSLKIMLLCVR